jgi:hypothetical protein
MEFETIQEEQEAIQESIKIIQSQELFPIFDPKITGQLIGGSYFGGPEILEWIEQQEFELNDHGTKYDSLITMMARVMAKLEDPIEINPADYYSINMVAYKNGVEVMIHIHEVRQMAEEANTQGTELRLNQLERLVVPKVAATFWLSREQRKLVEWNIHPAGHADIRMPWPYNSELGRNLPTIVDLFRIGAGNSGDNMVVINTEEAFKEDFLTCGWHGSELVGYAYFGPYLKAPMADGAPVHISTPTKWSHDPIFFMVGLPEKEDGEGDWFMFDILDRVQDAHARGMFLSDKPRTIEIRIGKRIFHVFINKWDTEKEYENEVDVEVNNHLKQAVEENALIPEKVRVYSIAAFDIPK